jgi:hypothetical protein
VRPNADHTAPRSSEEMLALAEVLFKAAVIALDHHDSSSVKALGCASAALRWASGEPASEAFARLVERARR